MFCELIDGCKASIHLRALTWVNYTSRACQRVCEPACSIGCNVDTIKRKNVADITIRAVRQTHRSALGQKQTNRPGPKSSFVRCCPKADIRRPKSFSGTCQWWTPAVRATHAPQNGSDIGVVRGGPQAEDCAASKQGLAKWVLMLPSGRDLLPAWSGPGRTEHSLQCYDRDHLPTREASHGYTE